MQKYMLYFTFGNGKEYKAVVETDQYSDNNSSVMMEALLRAKPHFEKSKDKIKLIRREVILCGERYKRGYQGKIWDTWSDDEYEAMKRK